MILEQQPFLVLWITSLLNPAEPKVTLHKAASKMYVSISLLFSTDLWPNCYYWQRQHCCNGDDLLMMASLAMKMVVMKIINVIWWGGFKYFLVFFFGFPGKFFCDILDFHFLTHCRWEPFEFWLNIYIFSHEGVKHWDNPDNKVQGRSVGSISRKVLVSFT